MCVCVCMGGGIVITMVSVFLDARNKIHDTNSIIGERTYVLSFKYSYAFAPA